MTRIADKEIQNTASLSDMLLSRKPGETVSVQIYRGEQQLAVNLKLGERQVS